MSIVEHSSRTSSEFASTSAAAGVGEQGNCSSRSWLSPSPVRFSVEQRAASPVGKKQKDENAAWSASSGKRRCSCSPTTHPGSFRCAYHKQVAGQKTASSSNEKLNLRRLAMKNWLVQLGREVEAEVLKRASSTTLIGSSSHRLQRRRVFEPRPSRLSTMSKAQDQESC
ncbi:hypothetical protein RJT34_25952 [Clitoria ternatea]|uniref:Uncharacterized protein n=1 Tax=Clitoria ternatea TaxID=43366 RepID=A0AAN9F6N1_CLITE